MEDIQEGNKSCPGPCKGLEVTSKRFLIVILNSCLTTSGSAKIEGYYLKQNTTIC